MLIVLLITLAFALVGCNRERPVPTPTGLTPVAKAGTPSPAAPGTAVTKIVLPGQTPQAAGAATPIPLTPGSPPPPTPISLTTREPAATAAASQSSAGAESTGTSGETVYTVQRGDTLGKIAARYGVTTKQIVDLNGIKNPNLIVPGQKLKIPGTKSAATSAPSGASKTYTVKAGDTLVEIATRHGVTVQALQQANNLANADQIFTGQILKIP
jgi:LysM repeat protein